VTPTPTVTPTFTPTPTQTGLGSFTYIIAQTGGGTDFEKYGYQFDNQTPNISGYFTLSGGFNYPLSYTVTVYLTSISKPTIANPLSSVQFLFKNLYLTLSNEPFGIKFDQYPVYIGRFPVLGSGGGSLTYVFPRDTIYGDNTKNWP